MSSADSATLWFQCRLQEIESDRFTVGWLPERGAKAGSVVELKSEGFEAKWVVTEVYPGGLSYAQLREHQKLNRDSLSSIASQQ
jgi:hypothetical protein